VACFPRFHGDVRLVELASLSDRALWLPSAVAGGLGLKLGGEISAELVARGHRSTETSSCSR